MWHLDEMISPIIKESVQELTKNEILLMEKIRKQKVELINKTITPAEIDLVRPEIVDSWVRCIQYGLDPYAFNYGAVLIHSEFQQLETEKSLFLRSAEPYLVQLQRMLTNNNYLILLTDENSVIMRVVSGNDSILEQITDRFGLMQGTVWTEDTVGTCPHILSLMLHSPFQLCGPEFYSETNSHIMGLLLGSSHYKRTDIYSDTVSQTSSSSAPIFDGYQNLVGSITIISPFLHYQNAHSLGLTVSTAWAIQNQLQLALNNELLSVTLEVAEEAVLTVNKKGIVTKTNARGQKVFDFLKKELVGVHIEEIFGSEPVLQLLLNSGEAIFDHQINIPGSGQKIHLKSGQPVKDKYGNHLGNILTFTEIKKTSGSFKHKSSFAAESTFHEILGQSIPFKESLHLAEKYAALSANLLIQGESGTGKELYAQAIHNQSRPEGPFVAINCAAIPLTLIESELFGYEPGAFTGAERKGRTGKIELANEGTLFLDEIGDMPMELQPVLLRVLEEKRIMRIGASKYTPVNFRLITASNKDLLELVKNNQFRADLYYRLAVLKILIPPLRERETDIIWLAKHFAGIVAEQQRISTPYLSDQAVFQLLQYDWPGNVRELHNVMIYAVNMAGNGIIGPEHLPPEISHKEPESINNASQSTRFAKQEQSIQEMEKIMIMQALINADFNVYHAADHLGISRSTLYRKMKSYGLSEGEKIKKRTPQTGSL